MNWLARWAYRKLVIPRVIAYMWSNEERTEVLMPDEIVVMFRG